MKDLFVIDVISFENVSVVQRSSESRPRYYRMTKTGPFWKGISRSGSGAKDFEGTIRLYRSRTYEIN